MYGMTKKFMGRLLVRCKSILMIHTAKKNLFNGKKILCIMEDNLKKIIFKLYLNLKKLK